MGRAWQGSWQVWSHHRRLPLLAADAPDQPSALSFGRKARPQVRPRLLRVPFQLCPHPLLLPVLLAAPREVVVPAASVFWRCDQRQVRGAQALCSPAQVASHVRGRAAMLQPCWAVSGPGVVFCRAQQTSTSGVPQSSLSTPSTRSPRSLAAQRLPGPERMTGASGGCLGTPLH
jgi:hypothetical protein